MCIQYQFIMGHFSRSLSKLTLHALSSTVCKIRIDIPGSTAIWCCVSNKLDEFCEIKEFMLAVVGTSGNIIVFTSRRGSHIKPGERVESIICPNSSQASCLNVSLQHFLLLIFITTPVNHLHHWQIVAKYESFIFRQHGALTNFRMWIWFFQKDSSDQGPYARCLFTVWRNLLCVCCSHAHQMNCISALPSIHPTTPSWP